MGRMLYATPRPLYPLERDAYPLYGTLGKPQGRSGHKTYIHDPGGIQTRNPSKRLAAEARLRPLRHWDRQEFDPRTVQPVASRYTD